MAHLLSRPHDDIIFTIIIDSFTMGIPLYFLDGSFVSSSVADHDGARRLLC